MKPNSKLSEPRSVISGLKWSYLSVALQGFFKLVALMVLARLLTPRDFGLLGFALLCTNFIERIAQGGIAPAIVQIKIASVDAVSTAWWMSVLLGCFSTVLIWICSGQIAGFFSEPSLAEIVKFLGLGCILEGLIAIPEALLQRELKFKELMFSENIGYFVSMVGVCITLAWFGYGVWSLVIAQLSLKLVRLIVVVSLSSGFAVNRFALSQARYLAKLGFGFSLGRLLNFFSLQGDNFVVGRLLGTEALGMYNRAYQLMTLPAMYVGQVFERVMFPAMARKQSKREDLASEFLIALEVLTLVALPVGVAMFFLAQEIVLVGFGERWRSVIPVVALLSFGVFFRTAYKCSDTVVRSLGAVYHYAGRQALYAGFVIGGALIGSLLAGIEGVAVGVVFAVAINYLSMTRLSTRLIGISFGDLAKAHLLGVWVSIWVMLALHGVVDALRESLSSPLCILIYGGIVATLAWGVGLMVAALSVPYGVMGLVRSYLLKRTKKA